jgi:hypothetical protein
MWPRPRPIGLASGFLGCCAQEMSPTIAVFLTACAPNSISGRRRNFARLIRSASAGRFARALELGADG